jgi:porin
MRLSSTVDGAFSISPAGQIQMSVQRQTALTGGWGGLRQTLYNDGIDFTGLYMMESAGNPTGGNLHKLRYTQDLGLAIYLDLDKLLGLKHTYFLATASQRVGNNLSGDIPNFFQVQQEYGHPTMRLDNLAIEEQLLDGRLDVVAGRIMMTSDFAYSDVSCYSQNLGLCDFRMGCSTTLQFRAIHTRTGEFARVTI